MSRRIIELRAENFKRLKAVCIRPDGDVVQITGRNRQGKTSVLDALWAALAGKSVAPTRPIREGAEEARITLDLGDIVVKRRFTRTDGGEFSTGLTVESADGARFPSPQKMLDGLCDALALDPLAFQRAAPKQQLDTLKRLVPGVDFDALELERQRAFDARTDANREAKRLRAQADGFRVANGPAPKRVDEDRLVAQLQAASERNTAIERRSAEIAQMERELGEVTKRAEEQRKQAQELLACARANDQRQADLSVAIENRRAELAEPVDTAALGAQLRAARDANALADAHDERAAIVEQANAQERVAAGLTLKLREIDARKQQAIEDARLPVPGIGLDESGVTLNGLPFDQASDAEQLRASIALAAAMAPELRVIRVRDGSLLDDESMQTLADFAAEHDLQIWVERVDSSGRVGFVLEDGHLAQPISEAAE